MRAEPRENYSDTYTASKEETTNEENTLLAKGGTADKADLKYFRHLYNLRWSADWDITNKGTYTLTPQAGNSTGSDTVDDPIAAVHLHVYGGVHRFGTGNGLRSFHDTPSFRSGMLFSA